MILYNHSLSLTFTELCYLQLSRILTLYTHSNVPASIQKLPDWPPGARTANGTALCHQVQLYRYFVSQSSEFCRHNPLCCLLTSIYCCKRIFHYRLSPETYGYTICIFFLRFLSGKSRYNGGCSNIGICLLRKSRFIKCTVCKNQLFRRNIWFFL
jgi:hypothetical protein